MSASLFTVEIGAHLHNSTYELHPAEGANQTHLASLCTHCPLHSSNSLANCQGIRGRGDTIQITTGKYRRLTDTAACTLVITEASGIQVRTEP